MPTRKVNFGLDSELIGRTNCTMLYNNLSRMIFFCQDVLRLNTLYTVPKNFLCGLPGRNFFDHEGRGGGKGSSPFLLSCARATSKSSLLALKKSAPRTLVCYAAVLSVVVLLPGALRDDTKRLCSRLLVLRLYYRKWPNKRPGRLFNFKGSSGGVYHVGGFYFYNCIV